MKLDIMYVFLISLVYILIVFYPQNNYYITDVSTTKKSRDEYTIKVQITSNNGSHKELELFGTKGNWKYADGKLFEGFCNISSREIDILLSLEKNE